MPSAEQSPDTETSTEPVAIKVNGRGGGRKWTAAQRAKLSASMKRAHLAKVKVAGTWKSKDTPLNVDAVVARQKQAAQLLQQGLSVQQVAAKMNLNDSTIYKYRADMQGRAYRGKKLDEELTAARLRLPVHIYTLAKSLKKATKTYIVAHEGDVDDLAMMSIALTRELLGE